MVLPAKIAILTWFCIELALVESDVELVLFQTP
jgi:hypothetical protein